MPQFRRSGVAFKCAGCANLHELSPWEVKAQSPKLEAVRAAWNGGKADGPAVNWVKIHNVPDYAYFNHAVHVNRGVSCYSCHGAINEMKVVYQHEPQSMKWCSTATGRRRIISALRSPSADSTRAACATSTFASTCGRCDTVAITTSCVSGSIAVGHAPIRVIARCSRSYAVPCVFGVGVRYQVASWKRSARARSTPAVSAPASGCPPMKRGSETSAPPRA